MAGLLSLAGALTYAELAAMMPRAGGEYVFLRQDNILLGPSDSASTEVYSGRRA